jgi:hypothetical protein
MLELSRTNVIGPTTLPRNGILMNPLLLQQASTSSRELVSHCEDELLTLSGWIIKMLMSAKFHVGSLLDEIG